MNAFQPLTDMANVSKEAFNRMQMMERIGLNGKSWVVLYLQEGYLCYL